MFHPIVLVLGTVLWVSHMSIKTAGLVINFHTLLIGDCSSMTTLFQILLGHLSFELNSHNL